MSKIFHSILFLLLIHPLVNVSYGKVPLKESMQGMFESFLGFLPWALDGAKGPSDKEWKELQSKIHQLRDQHSLKAANYAPSLEVLSHHFDEAYLDFTAKHQDLAKDRIKATINLCMSCHTQLPPSASAFILDKKWSSPWVEGEVQFLLRQYEKSKGFYQKILTQEKNQTLWEQSLQRLIFINLTLMWNIPQSIHDLKEALKIKSLSKMQQTRIQSLLGSIQGLESRPHLMGYFKTPVSQMSDLLSLMKQIEKELELNDEHSLELTDQKKIALMIYRGFLLHHITLAPHLEKKAEMLYWLGVSDYALNRSLYYGLGDYYLKSCIELSPKTPMAKRCFQAYEDEILFKYTGTRGTELPSNIKKELKRLEKLL